MKFNDMKKKYKIIMYLKLIIHTSAKTFFFLFSKLTKLYKNNTFCALTQHKNYHLIVAI